jgi:hypothetical protein
MVSLTLRCPTPAHLQFPVGCIHHLLKKGNYAQRVVLIPQLRLLDETLIGFFSQCTFKLLPFSNLATKIWSWQAANHLKR